MPGWFKKAWYGLASLLSFSSFILTIVALALPHWLSGKILCQTGVDLVNATDPELVKFIGDIYYGLFRGCKVRQCGLGGRQSQFTSEYTAATEAALEHLFVNTCMGCVHARSITPSNSLRPHGLWPTHQAPLSMGFSRQEYWSRLVSKCRIEEPLRSKA